jgi:hypothetical protein
MRTNTILGSAVIAGLIALSACGPPAPSQTDTATGAAPAAAGQAPNAAGPASAMQPGLWRTTVTVEAMKLPGVSEAQMREMGMVAPPPFVHEECHAQADIDRLMRSANDVETECTYTRNNTAGGRIDVSMVCPMPEGSERGRMLVETRGTYSPTRAELTTATRVEGGEPLESSARIVSERIGPC